MKMNFFTNLSSNFRNSLRNLTKRTEQPAIAPIEIVEEPKNEIDDVIEAVTQVGNALKNLIKKSYNAITKCLAKQFAKSFELLPEPVAVLIWVVALGLSLKAALQTTLLLLATSLILATPVMIINNTVFTAVLVIRLPIAIMNFWNKVMEANTFQEQQA